MLRIRQRAGLNVSTAEAISAHARRLHYPAATEPIFIGFRGLQARTERNLDNLQ